MKSVELTAYVVREYDVKYTVVLDENDPLLVKYMEDNELTLDDLASGWHTDLWQEILFLDENVKVEEDFGQGDERYVDFDAFITEDK